MHVFFSLNFNFKIIVIQIIIHKLYNKYLIKYRVKIKDYNVLAQSYFFTPILMRRESGIKI